MKIMRIGTLNISTPSERDVLIARTFDAPPELVFKALTTPDLVKQWSAPDGWTFDVCEIDLREVGKWRFQMRQPGGKVIGQFGQYVELVPGRRIVNTESWEDWDAGETLVATELVERDGGTDFSSRITFPSREVRDIVLKSGLEKSATPIYDKLAAVLAAVNEK